MTEVKICSSISPPSNPTATAASRRAKPSSSRSSMEMMAGPRPSTSAAPTAPSFKAIGGAAVADLEAAVAVGAVVGMASVEVVAEDTEAVEDTVLMVVVEEAAVEVDGEQGTVVEDTAAAEVAMAEEVVETVTIAESRGIWLGIAIRVEVAVAAGGMVVEAAEVEEDLATIAESRGILRENARTAR
eukprot:TRINITY_DN212_c1_g1_i3.p3 TRINITY_DN212_c1_g1~~TRINITY_DN212_c1_g1_i3.p3  ORF type:complete len:186 (-),score=42.82 TRINITY_DN212_c1_g1_i3:436-993(-)